ncbi:hypothetical protein ALMP_63840 [Streptomyces sp. A012304]|nr:hypothetical protein ALMP_63840 [Streptomyces sp. A012304]
MDAGELSVAVPARVAVAPPGPGGRGDYATNVALQLARPAGQPPLLVAEVLRPYLARAEGVTDVEITGPGFLNISLDRSAAVSALVRRILRDGPRYGHTDTLAGRIFPLRVPYEVRAEVLADALTRIVASQGGRVEIEHQSPQDGNSGNSSSHNDGNRGGFWLRPLAAPEDPTPLGPDAARWALLHPAPHDRPRVSADHLVQRESNPLFRVRYAHARTRAVSRNAADLGFTAAESGPATCHGDAARSLLPLLADHPRVLATVTVTATTSADTVLDPSAPSRLTRHLLAVADATLPLLLTVLPQGEEKPSAAHRARLALADAAGTVLAGGLSLLGIDAPDHL